MKYLLERLGERSTWLGLIAIATGAGINIQPEQANAVMVGGSFIGGIIAAITKD